jgi:hypothetical protein
MLVGGLRLELNQRVIVAVLSSSPLDGAIDVLGFDIDMITKVPSNINAINYQNT